MEYLVSGLHQNGIEVYDPENCRGNKIDWVVTHHSQATKILYVSDEVSYREFIDDGKIRPTFISAINPFVLLDHNLIKHKYGVVMLYDCDRQFIPPGLIQVAPIFLLGTDKSLEELVNFITGMPSYVLCR